jgi:adhesin transport system outer membrane protein
MRGLGALLLVVGMLCGVSFPAAAQSLRAAVQSALTTNPELKAADANFRALLFELLQRQGDYEPTVSLFGDVGNEYVDDPAGLSVADNRRSKLYGELGVIAELTLFDGYRRANEVYAAAARVDQSTFELLDASETMALLVAEQYINIARQQQLLQVARRNLARLREIERQADTLVQGGRLPASDRFQVEGSIFAARATIATIDQRLTEAAVRFKRLTGANPSGAFTMPQPVRPPASLEHFVRQSIQNSYRVRIASTNVDVRGYEQGIAESEFLPQLSLNAGASIGDNLDGSSGSERRAFIGIGLSWQLYGGGREERRQALGERRNEALYQRMAVIREVEAQATIAWNAFQTENVRNDLLAAQVRSYRQMRSNYEREFELTTRNVLDLLVAENRLFNAEFEQVNAAAILTFAGYRALAAQSALARHFGVAQSERLLGSLLAPKSGQKPLSVVSRGRALTGR